MRPAPPDTDRSSRGAVPQRPPRQRAGRGRPRPPSSRRRCVRAWRQCSREVSLILNDLAGGSCEERSEVQIAGVVHHQAKALRQWSVRKAVGFAHPTFHGLTQILADARKLARRGCFVLTKQFRDGGERKFLRVVAAQTQSIARLERRDRGLEGLPDGGPASGFFRVRSSERRRRRQKRLVVWQRLRPARGANAIDVSLREYGAQPRGQAAAPLKIPEQRLALAIAFAKAVQLGEQFVREIMRGPARGHGVRGTPKHGPVLANEALPRRFIAGRAGPGEVEVDRKSVV